MTKFKLFVTLLILSNFSFGQQSGKIVSKFMEQYFISDYKSAYALFSDEMKQQLSLKKLAEKDSLFRKVYGTPEIRDRNIRSFYGDKKIEIKYLWYGDDLVKFRFAVEDDEITEFNINRELTKKNWKYPEYSIKGNYNERPVLIQSKDYALPGEIIENKDKKTRKWVVFIHGSGASDRDESYLSLRVFRDMALGLAEYGISSLRYDKISYVFGAELRDENEFTIWDETGEDVVSAVGYLEKYESVKRDDIILIGHSQGAMMIPRICDSIQVGAAIMISGNARALQDLVYDQVKFLMGKDGLDKAEKRRLKIQKDQIKNLKKLKNTDPDSVDFVLPYGLSAYYWKDLLKYDQKKAFKDMDVPVFVIQGEGDYQVTIKDFRLFKRAALFSGVDAKFKSYDKVNHFLFENEKEASRDEYERQENVEMYIIDDIANWILKSDQ